MEINGQIFPKKGLLTKELVCMQFGVFLRGICLQSKARILPMMHTYRYIRGVWGKLRVNCVRLLDAKYQVDQVTLFSHTVVCNFLTLKAFEVPSIEADTGPAVATADWRLSSLPSGVLTMPAWVAPAELLLYWHCPCCVCVCMCA